MPDGVLLDVLSFPPVPVLPVLQMFLLISGGHIGAPKRYTNMASPHNALQRCVKRCGKYLRNSGPQLQRPGTWTNCFYISLL